jgi:hypothetical protein
MAPEMLIGISYHSRINPQAHGYTVVALHPESIQGIIYFSRSGGVTIFLLIYHKEKQIEWPR